MKNMFVDKLPTKVIYTILAWELHTKFGRGKNICFIYEAFRR